MNIIYDVVLKPKIEVRPMNGYNGAENRSKVGRVTPTGSNSLQGK
jgi:hypothetical protein